MSLAVRTLFGVMISAGLATTLSFAACSSGPSKGPAGRQPALPEETASPAPSGQGSGTTTAVAPPVDGGIDARGPRSDVTAAAARAAQRCDDPIATMVNHPDGGVIFNNAMTSADAGSLDRGQGIIDALTSKTEVFRCCFDAWLRAHPDREAKLLLQVALKPSGQVTKVGVDPSRSTITDDVAVTCVITVATEIRYPASPSGRETILEYPFRVVPQVR
jgi:hypothetical protein